jgi:hypothetical protein
MRRLTARMRELAIGHATLFRYVLMRLELGSCVLSRYIGGNQMQPNPAPALRGYRSASPRAALREDRWVDAVSVKM